MRGLRRQEDEKFEGFVAKVQDEAIKNNCIFFVDYEDGHFYEDDKSYLCDLAGWLIPAAIVDSFEVAFNNGKVSHEWDDYFCFAEWSTQGNELHIT